MTTRAELRERAPRNNSSPAGRRADRARSEAAALAEVDNETRVRQEKSARLRALRLERDGDAAAAE